MRITSATINKEPKTPKYFNEPEFLVDAGSPIPRNTIVGSDVTLEGPIVEESKLKSVTRKQTGITEQ